MGDPTPPPPKLAVFVFYVLGPQTVSLWRRAALHFSIICSAPQIVKTLTDLSGTVVRVIILRSLTVCAPHLLSMC